MTDRSPTPPVSAVLREVLGEAQRLGFLGARPIDEVVEHARGVVRELDGVSGRVIDLGSGGGVPGLIVAHDRPDLEVVLADRRTKRTDFLDRMVRRLGWRDRVAVVAGDVRELVAADATFDAAVARGFGPPMMTLEIASELVRPGGRIVITEPPGGDRWDPPAVAELGAVERGRGGGVIVFERC